jgi:rod shape-determining protein MreC
MTIDWRWLAPRLRNALLIMASLTLLVLNKANPELVEHLQTAASDFVAPTIGFLGQPLTSIRNGLDAVVHIGAVFHENASLRDQNHKLIAWQDTALRLEAENAALRAQLHVAADPKSQPTMVRVIGDPAGGYVESLMLSAGTKAGIEKGQPAVTALGKAGTIDGGALVGRVIQAGTDSARLLLITDVNSRIPVLLEQSHIHAILGGDDSDRPQLLFMPADASVTVGERLVTSGNDRLLPPGIAVGIVVENDETGIRVAPLADLSRLDFVTILKYSGVESLPTPEIASDKPRTHK